MMTSRVVVLHGPVNALRVNSVDAGLRPKAFAFALFAIHALNRFIRSQ